MGSDRRAREGPRHTEGSRKYMGCRKLGEALELGGIPKVGGRAFGNLSLGVARLPVVSGNRWTLAKLGICCSIPTQDSILLGGMVFCCALANDPTATAVTAHISTNAE